MDHNLDQRFNLLVACGWLTVAVVMMGLIAAGIVLLLDRPDQVWQAAVALGVCGGLGLVTFGLCRMLEGFTPAGVAYGFIAGTLLRLTGCTVAAVVVWMSDAPHSLLYWLAGAYLSVLMVEVLIVGRYVASLKIPGPAMDKASPLNAQRLENHG